jgi:hypothetical protein
MHRLSGKFWEVFFGVGVEFFYAWFATEFHLPAIVSFGNGVTHGVQLVTAHQADFKRIGLGA